MKAISFIFGPYRADFQSGKLEFDYEIDFEDREPLKFTEKIELPKPFTTPGEEASSTPGVESILQNLSLILGISYYKLYAPPKIGLAYSISESQAEFWNTVYKKGLGEFWYRNNLDPNTFPGFSSDRVLPAASPPLPSPDQISNRALIGIGGGKDSIVAVELLKQEQMDTTGFVVETQRGSEIIDEVAQALKIPVLKIRRTLDQKLFQTHPGSYNGHIPISAAYAWLGLLLARLYGFRYVVVGNERSSDFGNVDWKGLTVNHQWSKSSEFEKLFQEYVRKFITEDITYFSILRPFSELRVTKLFTQYPKYFRTFSSCNRNFLHHPSSLKLRRTSSKWCGECPKCAFVFAAMAAFLPRSEVTAIFGKDLLADKHLTSLYQDLSGRGAMKPFDCVGTFEETQAALWKSGVETQENGQELFADAMRVRAAPTLPQRFFFAGITKVLILGYGREGKVTETYLQRFYPHIQTGAADQKDGPDYLDKQADFEVAVKTPGIPRRYLRIPYTTATNIFFSRVSQTTIGVTGSKGKSTTASLIAAMLDSGGKKVELLGNIGRPMLGALLTDTSPDTIFVLELSSQQLEDAAASPNVAVITTLFPEHMDYHGSVEAYYAAKMNIAKFQTRRDIFVQDRPEIPVPDHDIPLLGEHNRQNIRAAVAVARQVGVSREAIARAIREFKPLPHRLEFVGEFRDVKFYDNASSTTPESTVAALKTLPRVETIFLGGLDRGYDFQELAAEMQKAGIRNVVLFPNTGSRIKALLPSTMNMLETRSMEAGVRFAYQETAPGKTVLLSASSPSYSLWTNFDEQGREYQKWIKALA